MRGTSSQFVVTIVVCSSATYGRTFIQAIHRPRVAYAVLKRHIRPICVWVRISGLIILYSHILLHSKTPEQCPKTTFPKLLRARIIMFPNRNGLLFIPFISKRKNNEEDNFVRLLYVLPYLPSDSMRILISNIHCPVTILSISERKNFRFHQFACHLRIDATLFLCLHLPSLPSKPQFPLCALSAPTKEKTASLLILFPPPPPPLPPPPSPPSLSPTFITTLYYWSPSLVHIYH